MSDHQILREDAEKISGSIRKVQTEIQLAIVGHQKVIEDILVCLFCNGHALLEGVPGLGKTYLIKTLGEVLDLKTSRVQFTPDLMPADIIGTNVLYQDAGGVQDIRFQQGPVFTHILLADEINRATPKTQSALLEAMQEGGVTVGGANYVLEPPFIVLATQNPIEMEGTYPLPEAQLDRFFFKLQFDYPDKKELHEIINRTTRKDTPSVSSVLDRDSIIEIQNLIREVPVSESVQEFAIDLVQKTHPHRNGDGAMAAKYVRYGASPRGAQSLVLAGKVYALLDGRYNVSKDDIARAAKPALRHRMILSFEGEAEGISPDEIIDDIIKS